MNIGFIGLGIMGNGMANNILKSGYPLTVYDVGKKAPATQRRRSLHVKLTYGSSQASDVVLTSLPGPGGGGSGSLGENGLIEGISEG